MVVLYSMSPSMVVRYTTPPFMVVLYTILPFMFVIYINPPSMVVRYTNLLVTNFDQPNSLLLSLNLPKNSKSCLDFLVKPNYRRLLGTDANKVYEV